MMRDAGSHMNNAESATSDLGSAGFTFVEAIVSLVILMIALTGALGLTSWMIRANAFSNDMTTALSFA